MSDDPTSPGGFSAQLRQERLLDEFEALCREGNTTAVLKFVDLYQSVSPSLFVEFVKIAHQYNLDINSTAIPSETKDRDLPTTVGESKRAIETAVIRSPTPSPQSPFLKHLGEQEALNSVGLQSGFRVLKELGSGGMGVVLLAEDQQLQRQVAIKVMRPHIAKIPGARERFLREARTMAAIENDHVVQVYHVGEENGLPYLAMPYLKGAPLDQVLRKQGAIPTPIALKIGLQVCLGLAAAHSKGLIHRDIKPANIWIETHRSWRVKLLDFGLARIAEADVSLTGRGEMLGTPAYMAPEQALGEEITVRADLFSVGVVLYELLIGKRPFDGPNALAVISKIAQFDPKPPHEVDNRIDVETSQLVMQLLAKESAARPFSAADCARELSRLIAVTKKTPESTVAPQSNPAPAAPRSPVEETYSGRSLETVQAAQPLLDLPDFDPLAPVTPYPSPAKVQFQSTPLIIAGAALLLSVAIMPIALLLAWPVLFPKAKDSSSTTTAKREVEREPTKTSSGPVIEPVKTPVESPKPANEPPNTSAQGSPSATPPSTTSPSTTPGPIGPGSIAPGSIAPGQTANPQPSASAAPPAPLPPRPIAKYNNPKRPLAKATVGKYELDLVLLDEADPKQFVAWSLVNSEKRTSEDEDDEPNLVLGIQVSGSAKQDTEAYACSARYELHTSTGETIKSTADKAFFVHYPLKNDDLIALCVSVPNSSEPVVIDSLKGYLICQPQSRVPVEFTSAQARGAATKSSDGYKFQIESFEESDSGLQMTVAITEPAGAPSFPTTPLQFEQMITAVTKRQDIELRIKDSEGIVHSPSSRRNLGGGQVMGTFTFQKEFQFGDNARPGNARPKEKTTTNTTKTPYRFQYTFDSMVGQVKISKVHCAVVTLEGEPKITPFEFQNIKVTE